MATQEILLQYKADISDLQAKVAVIEQNSRKVSQSVKTAGQNVSTGFKNLGASLAPLGAAIAGAFAVDKIISFGKEAIHAFQEAELNAKKLQVAVSVSGGLQQDFQGLLDQSKELQEITIFSDDDIQKAQTMALQFGLTSDEVNALIPVLTDFASATGQSLNEATSAVLRGLEGQGRGLKLYGVNVDSAKSKTENLASITQQLTSKFQGQAKIIGETGAGAIARYNNQIDDLKEELGQKLEPIFLAVTKAALTFTDVIVETAKGIELIADSIDLLIDAGNALAGDAIGLAERQLKNLQDIRKKAIEDNAKLTAQIAESFKNLSDPVIQQKLETYTGLLNKVIEARKNSAGASAKERSALAQDELTYRVTINALKQIVDARTKAANAPKLPLTEEQKKAAADAAKLLAEQNAKRAEAQKKADDELLQLTIDQIKNDFEKRREQSELDFSRFEKEKDEQLKQGLINQDTRNALVKAAQKKHEQELADITAEEDTSGREESLKNRLADIDKFNQQEITKLQQAFIAKGDFSEKAQEELNNRIEEQDLKSLQERLIAIRNSGGDITDIESQIAEKQIAINEKKNKKILENEQKTADEQKKIFSEINQAFDELSQGITLVNDAILQGKIDSLQAQSDANNEFFDTQQQDIDDALDKRLITEGQAEKKSADLKKERAESEKKSNEEIRKLKKKQAEIDKEIAIFKATINLAEAISVALSSAPPPFNAALAAISAALAGAQLAAIIATPIPQFKKGTSYVERGRNAIGDDTIPAMLDEGERVISKDKNIKHWDIYEAIDKDRLEQYVMKHYLTPELKKQQKTFEENKQKTFADNIGQSLIYNGLTYHEADRIRRKGTRITNEESLAKTIAKEVAKAIHRQTIYDR